MKLLDSIDQLRTAMDYHLQRHNILASNLAHVDTPNYHPVDLERRAAFDGKLKTAIAATDERHMGVSARGESFKVVVDKGASPGLDGNGVSLDREAVKIASNDIRYETVATLVADQLAMVSWAANDGR